MYDLETFYIVDLVISIILLIVFLIMVSNIGAIKQLLKDRMTPNLEDVAEMAVFTGQKEKAIDAYQELLYKQTFKTDGDVEEIKETIVGIIGKIDKLGGQISDAAWEAIEMNVGEIKK